MSMRRVYFRGHTLNRRTMQMILAAEVELGFQLDIMQGSYNSSVGASAGTHDGGGAVDVSAATRPDDVVRALRRVGFAAWRRYPSQGPWPEHIHAIAIGDAELSSGARYQVSAYFNGRNGLASNGYDDGPRFDPIPVWHGRRVIGLPSVQRQFKNGGKRSLINVQRVQKALNLRAGENLIVDGVAGPKTKAAYQRWERKVGAPEADGIPGPISLRKLVKDLYRVKK